MNLSPPAQTHKPINWFRLGQEAVLTGGSGTFDSVQHYVLPSGYPTTRPTVTAGAEISITGTSYPNVPLGRTWVVREVVIGADAACIVRARLSTMALTGLDPSYPIYVDTGGVIPTGGGEWRWDYDGGLWCGEGSKFQSWYIPPTTSGVFCTMAVHAINITADPWFDAKRTILIVGDSTSHTIGPNGNGTTTPTGTHLWGFRVRDRLRAKGMDVRLVNKAFGGAQTAFLKHEIRRGYLDVKFDLMMIDLGINDCFNSGSGNTVSAADFQANLAAYVDLRNRISPNASILFIGPSQIDEPTTRSAIGTYRGYVQTVANSFSGQRVYYVDASTAWTVPECPTYCGDSGGGGYVHPNVPGMARMADVICNGVETTDFYTSSGLTGEL